MLFTIFQKRRVMHVVRSLIVSLSLFALVGCGGGGGIVDVQPPVPGNSGNITILTVTSSVITIEWTKATDDTSLQINLSYRVYFSTTDNIATVTDCEANGTLALDWTADIDDAAVSSLAPGTTYYFNVVVTDEVGNKAAYTVTAATTLDVDGPVPGDGGLIAAHSDTSSSVLLSWTKASDEITSQENLEYKVVYSSSNNIITVETAEANGNVAVDFTANIDTADVTGLDADSIYYFNVVVRDESSKKSVYAMTMAKTLHPNDPVPGNNGKIDVGDISTSSVALSWTKADDDFTPQDKLEYRVYFSTSNNIRTVAEALENGTPAAGWVMDANSALVTGLTHSTTYYFNIVARDSEEYMQPYVSTSAQTTSTCSASTKCIYLVSSPSGNLGGVAGADALCNANRPDGVQNVKAMIVDGAKRVACSTSNCIGGAGEHIDWVLDASTTYYRPDTTVIGTTDNKGLFSFPLTDSFSNINYEIWTGMYTDWKTVSWGSCSEWTNGSHDRPWGSVGIASHTDRSVIYTYYQFCDRTNVRLVCVQQE